MSKRKCQTQQTSYVPEPMYRMRKILHYIMALQFLGTLSLYQILPLLHFLTNYFKKKSTTAVADTTRQLVES